MNTRWLKYLLFALILSLPFSGCREEELISPDYIGEGMAKISVAVDYEPHKAALDGKTRAAGNAINSIKDLAVVLYKPNGDLYRVFNFSGLTSTLFKDNVPGDYSGTAAEDETARVEISFPEAIPYGRYCMYVVANMGTVTEEMAASPENLKSQSVSWVFGENGDVSANSEMFGFMTLAGGTNETSIGFDAPVITVNKQDISLHSWVKRLASKVTIAYDGSGLNQDVWVYIHNVSLRQIPLECKLGEDNSPQNTKETGYVTDAGFGEAGKPADVSKEPANEKFGSGQYFYYNSKDEITTTDAYPNEYQYANWMMVTNGTQVKGSAEHTQSDPALYFYENMQGDKSKLPNGSDNPDKERYNKQMKKTGEDAAGENITPDMEADGRDYRDRVPCGTFIEVEAYYVAAPADDPSHKSEGPIKYRFMLGQNETYDYDAIRNHHYKLTLGFNGWANEPDWHIEYYEQTPEIVATEMYMPYLYNQSAEFPIRINGNVTRMRMEIIENNWGPYEEGSEYDIPPAVVGEDNYANRTTQFRWYRDLFINEYGYTKEEPSAKEDASNSNYLYGRHIIRDQENNKIISHLEGDANEGDPYYVTPIWVGFLRLQQPQEFESENKDLDMTIFAKDASWTYSNPTSRQGLKDYYFGNGGAGDWINNTTNLSVREFSGQDLDQGSHGSGRNSWTVEDIEVDGVKGKAINVKLWTQPKTMMHISGFSGNNPYEYYNRKAVIRISAWFDNKDTDPLVRDVPIIQARRLVNPKGIWRTSTNTTPFHFTLYYNQTKPYNEFNPLESRGSWSAEVFAGSGITISPEGGSAQSGQKIIGKTESNVTFQINFPGGQHFAVIKILYHGNSAVHYVICRQGYHIPTAIVDGGAEWSSYSLYSCSPTNFGTAETANGYIDATLTESPLALGTLFKKGNYNEGILISNLDDYGPREAPGQNNTMALTNGTKRTWLQILGIARTNITTTDNSAPGGGANSTSGNYTYTNVNGASQTRSFNCATWKWAKFNATDKDGNTGHYRVPTYDDFDDLLKHADIAVGVLYGDLATEPQNTTLGAYGFFDPGNTGSSQVAGRGMRGAFLYNNSDGRNIFFPVGTSGMARRTIQGLGNQNSPEGNWRNWAGVMRYSSVTYDLTYDNGKNNVFRPIPYNMPNVAGAIYWIAQERVVNNTAHPGWELNYFDLNFNAYDYAMSFAPYGDAVPIKLVKDGTGKPTTSAPRSSSKATRTAKSKRR